MGREEADYDSVGVAFDPPVDTVRALVETPDEVGPVLANATGV